MIRDQIYKYLQTQEWVKKINGTNEKFTTEFLSYDEDIPICNVNLHNGKSISGKKFVGLKIKLLAEDKHDPKHCVSVRIEFFIPSYCEWATVFEGWISCKEDLINVFILLGVFQDDSTADNY